jgi:hypothetical protein
MFIAALFMTAKLWNQPKCPITYTDKENVPHIQREYYSAIKKNEIISFAGKLMELEITVLS